MESLKNILDQLSPKGADWVGVRRHRTRQNAIGVKNALFDDVICDSCEGFYIEVMSGGHYAYAASSGSDIASLKATAAKALELALASKKAALHLFSRATRPASQLRYSSTKVRKSQLSLDRFFSYMISQSKAMMVSPKIVQSLIELVLRDSEIDFVSTSGAEINQQFSVIEQTLQAVAVDGIVSQKRTEHGPRGLVQQGGWELIPLLDDGEKARTIGMQALELLAAAECPQQKATLVLAPDQMMLQIHESVGHALELDRILGDERNYAGWSFISLDDIGKFQYGSPLMNITFDPTIPSEAVSYAADDIGNAARKEYIIKNGVLMRALGSLESQERAGAPGVANQRAQDWFRAPIDRMANLNHEPGTSSFKEIIESVEAGVYMESNRSWSIDDFRNKFQFGCEYAREIKDGRMGRVLRNPNYRGISSNFWQSLSKVGDAATFNVYGTPNCGKGEPNQVVTVGHGSPVCAFKDVEIFGGNS